MSKIEVDKVDPQSGTALEIGTSGDTITVPTGAGLTVTDEVKTNKISPATGVAFALGDSGDTFTVPSGATLTTTNATVNLPASVAGLGTGITNAQLAGSIDVTSKITGVVPTANLGSGSASSSTILYGDQTYKTAPSGMGTLLSTATASASSTIDITANIDSSYTLYQIVYSDVDMSTNNFFQVQLYLDGVLETSSTYAFAGMDFQDGSSTTMLNGTSTQFQMTANYILATAAYNLFGSLFLYNPSSTTSFKHISAITEFWMHDGAAVHTTMGGGLEATSGSAVTGIRFKPSSGTFDSGTFRLYGYNATQEIIMARHHLINGIQVPFTAEEETARDAEEAQAAIDKQAIEAVETAKKNKKETGRQKLKDLGLDDEEINALTGV